MEEQQHENFFTEDKKMTVVEKSVDLPTELTAELLVRGGLTLEQGESKKVFSLLKKGLERLIAQKVISNRVAQQFKQLKTNSKKEQAMELTENVSEDSVLTGTLVNVSIDINGQPFGTRFFQPKDVMDVQGHITCSDKYYRFMEAKIGAKYGITIRLLDPSKRYQIGIAVDGRCVLTGKVIRSDIEKYSSWNYSGSYVFDAKNENGGTILGWREDQDHIREFVFTDPKNSYAGRWNDLSAIGTIAIAVFREDISETCTARGGSRSIGTGYGDRIVSHVGTTSFESKGIAYETFVLNYQTADTLKKMGVWTPKEVKVAPSRMWPAASAQEFCKFPA